MVEAKSAIFFPLKNRTSKASGFGMVDFRIPTVQVWLDFYISKMNIMLLNKQQFNFSLKKGTLFFWCPEQKFVTNFSQQQNIQNIILKVARFFSTKIFQNFKFVTFTFQNSKISRI